MDLEKFFDNLRETNQLSELLKHSILDKPLWERIPPVSVGIDWGSDVITSAPDVITDAPNDLPRITVCDGRTILRPQMSACWDSHYVALGGVRIQPNQQCFISCTRSEKEQVLRLAESKWDTCPFTDGCQEFYGYDCRKCLEHRIKWTLTD